MTLTFTAVLRVQIGREIILNRGNDREIIRDDSAARGRCSSGRDRDGSERLVKISMSREVPAERPQAQAQPCKWARKLGLGSA